MRKLSFITLMILLALASATTLAQEPLLHFERVHTRIAGATDNRISVKVFADGSAIAAIPPYMKRSGRHEFELSAKQMSEITVMVDTLSGITQESLDEERASALSDGSAGIDYDVSDPDTVRFTITRNDRSQHSLATLSPDLMRDRQRSDSQLERLADMEKRLRALAQTAAGGEQ